MGIKTGKHWFLVKWPKKSCCVESRKWVDRPFIRRYADWCYRFHYRYPELAAGDCLNLCDPNAPVTTPKTFQEKLAERRARLSVAKVNRRKQ